MDYSIEFARQGLGFFLAVILASVVVYLNKKLEQKDKMISDLQEKRVIDSNTYSNNFILTSQQLLNQNKELMTLIQGNQKSIETIAGILQSLNFKR